MAKKNFAADIATGTDRFFSVNDEPARQDTKDTRTVQNIKNTPDTRATKDIPAIPATQKPQPPYRLNLKLDGAYKDFLAEEAWRRRTTITALINGLIGELKEKVEGE